MWKRKEGEIKVKVQREEEEERGMLNGLYKYSFAKSVHPCGVLSQDKGRLATSVSGPGE